MNDALNNKQVPSNAITSLTKPDIFNTLSEKNQKAVIDAINEPQKKDREGGVMGRWFGTDKDLSSRHILVALMLFITVVCFVDIVHAICTGKSAYTELTKNCIPLFTLALGYLFGQKS